MNLSFLNFLAGWKTVLIGFASIIIGVCDFIGFNIPDTGSQTAGAWIAAGVGAIALRFGLNNAVEQAIVSLLAGLGSNAITINDSTVNSAAVTAAAASSSTAVK